MTPDSSSSDGSKSLPKATAPVDLPAAPEKPVAEPGPSGFPEAIEMGEPADLPAEEEQEAEESTPAAAPHVEEGKIGFGAWLRSLSLVEKFCCAAIVLGVLVFGAAVFLPAFTDFPEEPERVKSADFPIAGDRVTVSSVETYWREPVSEGPDADKVRAETVLVPVFDAVIEGQGEVRVLFRNQDGEVAGDLASLDLSSGSDQVIAATAGFMQRGDFTAYQAGEIEPWIVEFHELPEGGDEVTEETELFKMKISPVLK